MSRDRAWLSSLLLVMRWVFANNYQTVREACNELQQVRWGWVAVRFRKLSLGMMPARCLEKRVVLMGTFPCQEVSLIAPMSLKAHARRSSVHLSWCFASMRRLRHTIYVKAATGLSLIGNTCVLTRSYASALTELQMLEPFEEGV
jgi:hypothetical protein